MVNKELLLQLAVCDELFSILRTQEREEMVAQMTGDTIQSKDDRTYQYCCSSAHDIILLFKRNITYCKSDADFEGCLRQKGLL
jgi:hypothetical protein